MKGKTMGEEIRVNEFGNEITDGFYPGDRYRYDFGPCSSEKGWTQYDTNQDAHYFGIWVHIEKRWIFSYVEGDTYLTKCPTRESFKAELKHMAEYYGEAPPAFKVITREGELIEYYDERPTG